MRAYAQRIKIYMVMDITFCTFFFDINRGNWDTFTVSNGMYMFWFDNLLSLNIKLHIETEEKFVEKILTKRKQVDPELKNTIIKVKKLSDLKAYQEYNSKLENLMFSEDFKQKVHHEHVPEMTKPLYNVLMFNKVNTLKEVYEENPFNTKYFSWVDAGFIRDEKWILGNENWPDPTKLHLNENKVLFFCINDNIIPNLKDKEFHCMSQIRFLKGTTFFLDGACIEPLRQLFNKNLDECLANEFIGSDEKIFDLCYIENPELFDLVRCDWRQEFKLYATTTEEPTNSEEDYNLTLSWNKEDIELCEEYDFWYIGVEDSTTKVLQRCDLNPDDHKQHFNFETTSLTTSFKSATKPHRFVLWPVSKDGRWLRRLEYYF